MKTLALSVTRLLAVSARSGVTIKTIIMTSPLANRTIRSGTISLEALVVVLRRPPA